ncbi:MAG: hypothetical protein J6A01_01345 [Proteobacteria bacterium]|nr:hypothetical protein [Pseudomonadota bacterium]
MFNKIASFSSFLMFILLVPYLAHAQDEVTPSFEEKFGGWYIDVDAQGGAGLDVGCNESWNDCYGEDHKKYNEAHHTNIGIKEYALYHADSYRAAGLFKVNAGYLFGVGKRFFIGPEISISSAFGFIRNEFNMLANADARFRFVAAIVGGHAVDLSAGLGWTIDSDFPYLPLQLGYTYTFDNGFMIGCSFELRLLFTQEIKEYGDDVLAYPGWIGAGIRLGYRFGRRS